MVNESSSYNVILNVTNSGNEAINITWSRIIGSPVTLSIPSNLVLGANQSMNQTFTYAIPSGFIGAFASTIYANANNSDSANKSFSSTSQQTPSAPSNNINSSKLCSAGIKDANLSLSSLEDRSNVDDDWDWKALDDIKIRVTLENTGAKDNEDYRIQLYFFDDTGKDVSSKFVDNTDSLKQEVDNLDSDYDEDVDFAFKLSTDVDSGSYTIVVKAIKRGDERNQCDILEGSYQEISIDQEEDYAIVTDVEGPLTASCGSLVDLVATVSNTGSNDQDRIKVTLYNRELGINIFKEIDNLNSGDSADLAFSISVPQGAQEKLQRFEFSTDFNYDDNDESYDDQSDSADDYKYSLNVLGNCVDAARPTISYKLNSTPKVGENLVIEVAIKNNANQTQSYFLSVDDYDSWATLSGISQTGLTIDKQLTKSSFITFAPSKSGRQTFNVEVVYNGKTITQPVTIDNVEGAEKGFFARAIDNYGKLTVWLITAIIGLIVLIVIILLIRLIINALR